MFLAICWLLDSFDRGFWLFYLQLWFAKGLGAGNQDYDGSLAGIDFGFGASFSYLG